MSRKILIVTATEEEASVIKTITLAGSDSSLFGGTRADFLVTGIGTIACARGLLNYFHANGHPDLAINAGIAGSLCSDLAIGDTAVVWRDGFADFGIDDKGRFIAAADAGLVGESVNPFVNGGWIESENSYMQQLNGKFRFCTGITSDTVSGSTGRISFLKNRFNPDIETMEGASFFYICALEKVPFIAVRAVSNMVEVRDRSSWDIPLAVNNLGETLRGIITMVI
jgi:futalosine hydrolase